MRNRRRRVLRVLGLVCLAVLLVGLTLRHTSPVGYFTSVQAHDRFRSAYDRAMADLPRPERTLDVRTRYGIVRVYRFAGAHPDRAPLVLLPGRASASPVWADNLPSLLALRPAYTVDLLGEPGLSSQDTPLESSADQAAWLADVLHALPEPQVHLVGLSIGGWTATNLAVHHPARVASLTLIDPVFVFSGIRAEVVLRSIPAGVRWLPKAWRDNFASWTANGAPVDDVPVAQLIEAGMQAYAMKLPAPQRIADSALTSLDIPVLAVLAGRSRMHDATGAADLARRTLRHGTVLIYPQASHAINGEQPEQIAEDLGAFLKGQP